MFIITRHSHTEQRRRRSCTLAGLSRRVFWCSNTRLAIVYCSKSLNKQQQAGYWQPTFSAEVDHGGTPLLLIDLTHRMVMDEAYHYNSQENSAQNCLFSRDWNPCSTATRCLPASPRAYKRRSKTTRNNYWKVIWKEAGWFLDPTSFQRALDPHVKTKQFVGTKRSNNAS